jgi:hypothetical protein
MKAQCIHCIGWQLKPALEGDNNTIKCPLCGKQYESPYFNGSGLDSILREQSHFTKGIII